MRIYAYPDEWEPVWDILPNTWSKTQELREIDDAIVFRYQAARKAFWEAEEELKKAWEAAK